MRIIAGDLKGKKLVSIKGQAIRPTSDRLRETIFNILANRFVGTYVLDLFAGTGALGIEAISRGALFACFIDNDKEAVSTIKNNIKCCRLESKSIIIQWDINRNLKCIETLKKKFNLVFIDPPYNADLIKPALVNLQQSETLINGALLIVEHAISDQIPNDLRGFKITNQRKYRKTSLSMLTYMYNHAN